MKTMGLEERAVEDLLSLMVPKTFPKEEEDPEMVVDIENQSIDNKMLQLPIKLVISQNCTMFRIHTYLCHQQKVSVC